ncbi:MAG: helix-turn-helix domain-containing protein [Thermoplasmatales archaeon]
MAGKSIRAKEEKAGIVMKAFSGDTPIAEICRRYNVTSSSFYKWRDAFIAGGTASLESGKSSDAGGEGDRRSEDNNWRSDCSK